MKWEMQMDSGSKRIFTKVVARDADGSIDAELAMTFDVADQTCVLEFLDGNEILLGAKQLSWETGLTTIQRDFTVQDLEELYDYA